jgi:Skp family chaperone for outer membrane proteins
MDYNLLIWILFAFAMAIALVNIINFVRALSRKKKAEKRLKEIDAEIGKVREKLDARRKELEEELKKTMNKLKDNQKFKGEQK